MAKILSMGCGDELIKEGDTSDSIFLLKSGHLNVLVRKNNKNVKVGEINSGELVGAMAFVEKKPRSATIMADQDSELLVISRESFKKSIEEQPVWLQEFIKTLMKRIRHKNEEIKSVK